MATECNIVIIEVPGLPPSVNHYKKPVFRGKGHKTFILSPEAIRFRDDMAIFARGKTIAPSIASEQNKVRYGLAVTIFLGPNGRGDGDNYWKCIGDSLVNARVIHSDARVRAWHIEVEDRFRTDPRNPRTLIVAMQIEPAETWAEQYQKHHLSEK